MAPAVGLLEISSIAKGIEAGDAMVKRAPLEVIRAGTVHPGKYLVLVGGLTADVEEAMQAGREVAGDVLVNEVFLPDVHPDVVASIGGARRDDSGEALGIVETLTVAATIEAADAGIKGARVTIRDLRLADELGGKGYVLFGGELAEVEAAVGYGVERVAGAGQSVTDVVISQLHAEMRENLTGDPRFGERARDIVKSDEGDRAPATLDVLRGRPLPGSGTAVSGGGAREAGVEQRAARKRKPGSRQASRRRPKKGD